MKKLIVLSLVVAVTMLAGGFFFPSLAQSPANDDKPSFYHLVPGTYVNGFPRFTIHYPKDWIEGQHPPGETFHTGPPEDIGGESLDVGVSTFVVPPVPPDRIADRVKRVYGAFVTDITIVSNNPSHLADGTPAQEIEIKGTANGFPYNGLFRGVLRGGLWVLPQVVSRYGKIGEHLKAILSSFEFQPGFDEPVTLPLDVLAFVDEFRKDLVGHDIAKVMSHYANDYLNSGVKKGEREQQWKGEIDATTSLEIVITDFVPAGDRAYLAGSITSNRWRLSLEETSLIRKNNEWQWYGNQRDAISWLPNPK